MKSFSHENAVAILTHADLDVVPFQGRYDALGAKLGLRFDAIGATFDALPLCQRGEAHARGREAVALLLAERTPAALAALPNLVERRFGRLQRLGPCDLLRDVVEPCVDDLLTSLIGLPIESPSDSLVSRIFSMGLGVSRRLRLEAELATWRERLAAAYPTEDVSRRDGRLVLVIQGRDALIGSLALSLMDHLENLDGMPLNSFRLPPLPTRTGVPYLDRVATRDVAIGSCPIREGEAVRVLLSSFEDGPEAARQRFFGAGRHLCLGRRLTLALWEQVGASLGSIGTRARITAFAMRRDDVFALPQTLEIEVTA